MPQTCLGWSTVKVTIVDLLAGVLTFPTDQDAWPFVDMSSVQKVNLVAAGGVS